MSSNADLTETSNSRWDRRISKASAIAGIVGLPLTLLTLGIQVPLWLRIVAGSVTLLGFIVYLYAERVPLRRLIRRTNAMFSGASKWDLTFDLLRIAGIAVAIFIPLTFHGRDLFKTPAGMWFLAGLGLILAHPVYRFFRGPSVWDRAYKLRKAMLTAAIYDVTVLLEDKNYAPYINRIEINVLSAIKSYVEYSVTDIDRDNFRVNLLVKDPHDEGRLVCIQRHDLKKRVPKFYDIKDMTNAMKAFNTRRPIYIGRFQSRLSPERQYKMVWLVPILDQEEGNEVIGLVGIDSLKPNHLDLEDGRESLFFHLLPYMALLRHTLTLRRINGLWY